MASRDFLGRFGGEKGASSDKAGGGAGQPDEVVELSLGLSLGGANSGRDAKKPRLVRSSSLAAMCSLPVSSDDLAAATPLPAPLMRTSSLPTETEEERWRRREMRSSSLAAMCSLPVSSDDLAAATPLPAPLMRTSSLPTETEEERWRRREMRSSSLAAMCSLPVSSDDLAAATPPPAPLMRTSSLPAETEEERWRRREMQSLKRLQAKRKRLERRTSMNSGKSGGSSSRDDAQEPLYPSAFQLRRSVVDQGNTSSSMPEQGSGDGAEAKSTSSMEISSDNNACNQNKSLPPPSPAPAGKLPNGIVMEQPPLRTLRSLTMRTTSTGDLRKSMMEDMPMVSSKLDGPNGKKIDGFLYKYRKGEEVRIVCVCHGNFLTPAEFVKHAGGSDVTNPLRHIVVNPSPSVFL